MSYNYYQQPYQHSIEDNPLIKQADLLSAGKFLGKKVKQIARKAWGKPSGQPKLDMQGQPILDQKTGKPIIDTDVPSKYPGAVFNRGIDAVGDLFTARHRYLRRNNKEYANMTSAAAKKWDGLSAGNKGMLEFGADVANGALHLPGAALDNLVLKPIVGTGEALWSGLKVGTGIIGGASYGLAKGMASIPAGYHYARKGISAAAGGVDKLKHAPLPVQALAFGGTLYGIGKLGEGGEAAGQEAAFMNQGGGSHACIQPVDPMVAYGQYAKAASIDASITPRKDNGGRYPWDEKPSPVSNGENKPDIFGGAKFPKSLSEFLDNTVFSGIKKTSAAFQAEKYRSPLGGKGDVGGILRSTSNPYSDLLQRKPSNSSVSDKLAFVGDKLAFVGDKLAFIGVEGVSKGAVGQGPKTVTPPQPQGQAPKVQGNYAGNDQNQPGNTQNQSGPAKTASFNFDSLVKEALDSLDKDKQPTGMESLGVKKTGPEVSVQKMDTLSETDKTDSYKGDSNVHNIPSVSSTSPAQNSEADYPDYYDFQEWSTTKGNNYPERNETEENFFDKDNKNRIDNRTYPKIASTETEDAILALGLEDLYDLYDPQIKTAGILHKIKTYFVPDVSGFETFGQQARRLKSIPAGVALLTLGIGLPMARLNYGLAAGLPTDGLIQDSQKF